MTILPITILIYQLLAAFGALALTAIVAKTSADFQLMFAQGPVDKLLNWRRFKSSAWSKLLVIFLTIVSTVILFLPTLLAFAADTSNYKDYYYSNVKQYSQEEYAQGPFSNPNPIILPTSVENYPPFDDFRVTVVNPALQTAEQVYRPWANTESIVKTYLYKKLNLPIEPNVSGEWYGVMKNLSQRADYRDFYEYQKQYEAPTSQKVDASTGKYYTDSNQSTYTFGLAGQNSFSLKDCDGQLTSNLTDFEGHQILAVSNSTAGVLCYPRFDASLPVTVQIGSSLKSSLLDEHYGVFRSARLDKTVELSSSIIVTAMNLNESFITMAIKKQTHIKYHATRFDFRSDNFGAILNCTEAGLNYAFTNTENTQYNSYNHTKILCQLSQLSQQNPSFTVLQATRRSFSPTSFVNSLYTFTAPTTDNPLGGLSVDLTFFATYTLKSPVFKLPEGEHLIAHAIKNGFTEKYPSNIEAIVTFIDIFGTEDITEPTLPNLVKIQAALKTKNYYYFSKWTASVHYSYNFSAEPQWISIITALGVIFFVGACWTYTQKSSTLRAWISTCPPQLTIDDTATLVDGRDGRLKAVSTAHKPTRFALIETSNKSNFPVLIVDDKTILLT